MQQFKSINSSALSFIYSSTLTSIHDYGKTIALTRWTFVGKVMSLLLNMLSRLVITFLPRRKCLLISLLLMINKDSSANSDRKKTTGLLLKHNMYSHSKFVFLDQFQVSDLSRGSLLLSSGRHRGPPMTMFQMK